MLGIQVAQTAVWQQRDSVDGAVEQIGFCTDHLHKLAEERMKTMYSNETELFVETRRAQTSDRRQAQSVTQIGKSVFSQHVYAPTKTVTDKQEPTVTGRPCYRR